MENNVQSFIGEPQIVSPYCAESSHALTIQPKLPRTSWRSLSYKFGVLPNPILI
jgi:hypothetical protein